MASLSFLCLSLYSVAAVLCLLKCLQSPRLSLMFILWAFMIKCSDQSQAKWRKWKLSGFCSLWKANAVMETKKKSVSKRLWFLCPADTFSCTNTQTSQRRFGGLNGVQTSKRPGKFPGFHRDFILSFVISWRFSLDAHITHDHRIGTDVRNSTPSLTWQVTGMRFD